MDAKGSQKPPKAEGRKKKSFSRAFEGIMACQHIDFILLASKTTRGKFSVTLSHSACSTLLQWPWGMNAVTKHDPEHGGIAFSRSLCGTQLAFNNAHRLQNL